MEEKRNKEVLFQVRGVFTLGGVKTITTAAVATTTPRHQTKKLTKEASRKKKLKTYVKAESNSRNLCNNASDERLELSRIKREVFEWYILQCLSPLGSRGPQSLAFEHSNELLSLIAAHFF